MVPRYLLVQCPNHIIQIMLHIGKKKSIDNSESYNLQESFAVTKDDIYNEAKKHVGSTKWKLVGNTYKCNIFVDDVFANVGAKRPQR